MDAATAETAIKAYLKEIHASMRLPASPNRQTRAPRRAGPIGACRSRSTSSNRSRRRADCLMPRA